MRGGQPRRAGLDHRRGQPRGRQRHAGQRHPRHLGLRRGPCGIVTSGNYRKFFIRDGRKYAHTIDPRTGYPVTHDLLSATVVAPTAAEADALATACMVIGPEGAQRLIDSRPDLEGYLITGTGTWMSDGFRAQAR